MKIALAQIKVRAGRPDINFQNMLDFCRQAAKQQADLIVFPELAVSGSFLGQAWASPGLLAEIQKFNQKLIAASSQLHEAVIVFGSIGMVKTPDGNSSPTSAIYVAQNGTQLSSPAGGFRAKVNGQTLDFALLTEQQSQPAAPIVLKLATSCFVQEKTPQFYQSFAAYAKTYGKTLVYVNHVGVQDAGKPVYVYDGASAVFNPDGELLAAAPQFAEHLLLFDTEHTPKPLELPKTDSTAALYDGLVHAIREYSTNLGINRAVIGLSGGIDSCLNACLLTAALGKENVLGINLPSRYNSDATRECAEKLAANLGIRYEVLPIQDMVNQRAEMLARLNLPLSEEMLENVQSRERGSGFLAAAASAFGGAVICNGNKSEFTIGYATMYGDAIGYFAPLGDLWKCQIYEIARYIYETSGLLPLAALELQPSAELSDAQDIEKGLGDPLCYAYHDYLFRSWVEWGQDITDSLTFYEQGKLAEVTGCGTEQLHQLFPDTESFLADLERWWQLYRGLAVAKRLQAPPVLSLSRRAFGADLPESQTGCHLDDEYLTLKAKVLAKADQLAF